MRLDKFLKVSRILKRRSVANDACSAQRVEINGKPAKPAKEVNVGDKISLSLGERKITFIVKDIFPYSKKEDAEKMFEVIDES